MLGEGIEESATQITQNAIDKYTDVSPDINLMDGVSDAFILGIGSGGVFGTALEGIKKISKDKTTKEDVEVVENTIDKRGVLEEELNEQIKEGETTNELASETISNFDEIKKQLQAIPKDYTSEEKAVAVDLLKEKSSIENEIKGLDETLIEDKKSRIIEINEELKNIKKPKVESTVSEQTTEFAQELGTPTDVETVAGATSVKIGDTEVILNTEGDNIVLESIRTDEEKRGQGSAKNALDKIVEVADVQGKTIELKVVPETETTTQEGLTKLYEDAGFIKEGNKMVREPKTGFEAIDEIIDETTPKTTEEAKVDEVLPKQDQEVKIEKETTVKPIVFETDKNTYTVTVKDSKLEIVPKFGKAKPSNTEIKKVTEQYLAENDFSTGKIAEFEGKGDLSDEQISDVVANESENAVEVANEIKKVQDRNEDFAKEKEVSKQNAIAELVTAAHARC